MLRVECSIDNTTDNRILIQGFYTRIDRRADARADRQIGTRDFCMVGGVERGRMDCNLFVCVFLYLGVDGE